MNGDQTLIFLCRRLIAVSHSKSIKICSLEYAPESEMT